MSNPKRGELPVTVERLAREEAQSRLFGRLEDSGQTPKRKKAKHGNLNRDDWAARAYRAEMRLKKAEVELATAENQRIKAVAIAMVVAGSVGWTFGYLCFAP